MCLTAGQFDPSDPSKPLHECDIYGNKDAGAKLAAMLSMGSSKPWPEAMKAITGQERMDATAFREYFKPLETWLIAENEKSGEKIGWEEGLFVIIQFVGLALIINFCGRRNALHELFGCSKFSHRYSNAEHIYKKYNSFGCCLQIMLIHLNYQVFSNKLVLTLCMFKSIKTSTDAKTYHGVLY